MHKVTVSITCGLHKNTFLFYGSYNFDRLKILQKMLKFTKRALWAAIGGPLLGFIIISVWSSSFNAAPKASRKPNLSFISISFSFISLTRLSASAIP